MPNTKTAAPLSSIIDSVADGIASGRFGKGGLAELRRLNIDSPDKATFWKIFVTAIAPSDDISATNEREWAVILKGMGMMAPHHHSSKAPLGFVLAQNDFSEMRLLRLLRSQGSTMNKCVMEVCHFLGQKRQPFDWYQMAMLILSKDIDKKESIRRRIASDYYRKVEKKGEN